MMKQSALVKWCLIILTVLLGIAGGLWLAGWWPNFDRSIVLTDRFGNVQNGFAFDQAALALGTATKVVLPDNAKILKTGEAGKVQIFVRKYLAFAGHLTK